MILHTILACDENYTIAKDGEIPWKCSTDLRIFKELTQGKKCFVGRKTYDTLPPLKGRDVIVISGSISPSPRSIDLYDYISDMCGEAEDVFVIGGASIYNQLATFSDFVYLTVVETEVQGDNLLHIDQDFMGNLNDWYVAWNYHQDKDEKNEFSFRTSCFSSIFAEGEALTPESVDVEKF